MLGKIYRYLADDHRRLDALLERRYGKRFFFLAAQKLRGGEPLPVAPRLRLDHGDLVALLVPSPTAPVVAAIRAIFKVHNPIEEEPGGMYDHCEQLAEAEREIRYWSRCTLTVLEFVLGSMGGRDLRRLRHLSASRSGLDGFGQRRCFHAI